MCAFCTPILDTKGPDGPRHTLPSAAPGLSAAVQTPVLLFLDEVDSLAPAEGGETPLTSQRLLATLLAQIDGPAGVNQGQSSFDGSFFVLIV